MPSDTIDTAARIETPEHIEFEFRIAGPWRRAIAYVVDLMLRSAILFLIGLLATLSAFAFKDFSDLVDAHAGLVLIGYFVIEWFYYVLFEWLWDGRTPGKRVMSLRVVKDGGFPIGLQDALLRNLLRSADLLPAFPMIPLPTYLVGVLVSAADSRFRRLGDLVAGTMVIIEEPRSLKDPVKIDPPPRPEEMSLIPPHPRLTIEERKTIDAFMRRLATIHPERREELCNGYAQLVAERLGVPRPRSGTRFLQLLYARLAETAVPLRRGRRDN